MTSLRLLICRNARLSGEPNFLSNELRLIDWVGYPGEHFPPNFRGEKLVILRMALSRIKILETVERFQNLTTMTFFECRFLEKIPDVSRIPNLESLVLFFCENLVEVHHSVGSLNKLVKLSIILCSNLRSFPKRFKFGSLKYLKIFGCSMLMNFPEIECGMECLEEIRCKYTGIEELLSFVGNLVGLKNLSIGNSRNILDICQVPSSCPSSNGINESILNYCTNLTNFSESNFLRALGCRSTLKHLNLSFSGIVTLPRCIESFVTLASLFLDGCKQLREILGLPPNVQVVRAKWCVSLEIFLEGSRSSQLFNTEDPPEPVGVGIEIPAQQSLSELDLSGCSAIVSLPRFFNRFVQLRSLNLEGCKQLREVPELPRNIVDVDLGGCTSLEILPFNNIYDLPKLWWIDFSHCPEQIGNAVQNHLFSEGQPKLSLIRCIYPGNRIPDCFSYCKEVSNTHLCEIDTGPLHFDSENVTFAFFAVIGTRDDGKDESIFSIDVKVFNNGQEIHSNFPTTTNKIPRPDHVMLSYRSPHYKKNKKNKYRSYHSQLMTNNLRVKFEIKPPPRSVFFKSCAFHIIEQGHDDDESDRNPTEQR
ncbi:protein SUPPRESSOR OF npr1-1, CONSTITUTIVE 1-like isoform X1 [Corylus avellana]|uniref:protein SUPPRESSOR OF npr1-1, CONSTITUTIVE 1-like isoform X1 n=1 Tax=Corylus avellana TaxID=13451 RepID=UPI00286C7A20|nr:protein SUPPRESSOR OF npr1-1, CONSTITUTIVE 1-like isoform X1 [Corylus avellana]XP_059454792.1 protein SUPPRESSOR OF npr1-1, CONSTITUTIVE 1-like isoform X1 [Corylus avellana]XP_059454793.1 protein SUPPRESSOR OF npr1-1, CONSTITUTIVE 1-like isoform X1 [Corylus avellana]XP_059454794.1 protein SUPPRESSOR OF npr1-1, CONSTITUTIVE 1-like isoform X1 [Corylus avellana]XP_059454795.1 protein SUPPRESSOR OF npr1-1, CONSTITUTIVE 1-like isoform X1 [Corylus avellana]XP_059454796.1 protein SUPPRESSOR OF npr